MNEGDELLRTDGPADAARTVLLAHGAGAGMDSEFLVAVAQGLAAAGHRVVRFEFPYMAARRHGERRGPDPAPRLCAHYRALAARFGPPQSLVLAGKSMGGRIATMVADELGVAGVAALGYPFHPPKEPARLRTAHLAALTTPCLILQGERDPFGTRPEVESYALSPSITVHWLPDGDHSFGARQKSGHSTAQNLATAIERLSAFTAACGAR